MPAGYSGTPLVKKLGLKSGMTAYLDDAPENYHSLLNEAPEELKPADVDWRSRAAGSLEFIHLFVTKEARLNKRLPLLKSKLTKTGTMWISWPKKSSGGFTEVDEAMVRSAGLDAGLVDVKICAVDGTWSGLKFVYRKADR